METNDILMVVGILTIILFLVSVGMSYKSWRAYTMILVFLIFCVATTQVILAAYVLRTQQTWQEIILGVRKPDKVNRSEGLKIRTENLDRENTRLQEGNWVGGVLQEEGIDQIKQRNRAVVLDRGSIWKNCVPLNPQANGNIDLQVPFSERELAYLKKENKDDPLEERPRKDMLVYAFQEADFADGCRYLGEFRIDKVTISGDDGGEDAKGATFTTATLVPSLPLSAEGLKRLSSSTGNWTIYDKMPVDSHYIFAEVEDRSKWLPKTTVAEYDKDLQPAEETDPANRIEVLVRFTQDYETDVPLFVRLPGQDADEDPTEIAVKFDKNQLAWIGKETVTVGDKKILGADDLAEAGIVTIRTKVRSNFDSGIKLPGFSAPQSEDDATQIDVAPRYVRPLRNYRKLFNQVRVSQVRQQKAAVKIGAQSTQIVENQGDSIASLATLNETINRLKADTAQHANEEKVAKAHLATLDEQYKNLRAKREQLFQDNARLAAELDRLEKQAARAIDRRTRDTDQTKLIQPTRVR